MTSWIANVSLSLWNVLSSGKSHVLCTILCLYFTSTFSNQSGFFWLSFFSMVLVGNCSFARMLWVMEYPSPGSTPQLKFSKFTASNYFRCFNYYSSKECSVSTFGLPELIVSWKVIPSEIAEVDPRFFFCSLASFCVLLTAPAWYLEPAEVFLQVDLCLDSFLEQYLIFILFLEVGFFLFFLILCFRVWLAHSRNIQCCPTAAVSTRVEDWSESVWTEQFFAWENHV